MVSTNHCVIVVIVVLAACGIALVVWRRRVRVRVQVADRDRALAYERFLDTVLVALQAGISVTDAVRRAAETSVGAVAPDLQAIISRVDKGEQVHTVLPQLIEVFGARCLHLVDIIDSSLVDGMPVMHIIGRLADEARAERRRQLNEDLRRLPIRLVFPLAFCVLPSFVLLTVVPIALRTLSTLEHPAQGQTQGAQP